jgi:hypothetical protein
MRCGNQLAPTLTINEAMPGRNVPLVTLPLVSLNAAD